MRLSLCLLLLSLLSWSSPTSPGLGDATLSATTLRRDTTISGRFHARWTLRDPTLLAIRQVESSGGKNCKRGRAGELTCFQIKPATAEWVGCSEGWEREPDGRLAAECAERVLDKARELCRRTDIYGLATFYGPLGRCMGRHERPRGYAMDVAYARLRFL